MTPIDSTLITTRLDKGTLVRCDWGDGYERACLLASIHPDCATRKNPAACPAELMPAWMAYLTVFLADRGSRNAWPDLIRRYAAVAGRWHVLSPEQWDRLHKRVRAACCREAIRHTGDATLIGVCAEAAAEAAAVAGAGVSLSRRESVADGLSAEILRLIEVACDEAGLKTSVPYEQDGDPHVR